MLLHLHSPRIDDSGMPHKILDRKQYAPFGLKPICVFINGSPGRAYIRLEMPRPKPHSVGIGRFITYMEVCFPFFSA